MIWEYVWRCLHSFLKVKNSYLQRRLVTKVTCEKSDKGTTLYKINYLN